MITATIEVETLAEIPALQGRYEIIGDQILEEPRMGAFEFELASILHDIMSRCMVWDVFSRNRCSIFAPLWNVSDGRTWRSSRPSGGRWDDAPPKVAVQIRGRGGEIDGGAVVAGFRLCVDHLFGPERTLMA